MREQVRLFLCLLGALAMAAAAVLVVTAIVRAGMTAAFVFVVKGIPAMLLLVSRDPLLILAVIIAAIIVWARPWEPHSDDAPSIRRGRELLSLGKTPRRAQSRPTEIRSLRKARERARSRLTAGRSVPRRPPGP